MRKISYFQKTLLVFIFLILPLLYTVFSIQEQYESDTQNLRKAVSKLQENETLYQMMHLVHRLERRGNAYLLSNTITEKSAYLQAEDALIQANKMLLNAFEQSVILRSESLLEKVSTTFAEEELKRFNEFTRNYKTFLYEQMRAREFELKPHANLNVGNILYLLNLELPESTLSTSNIMYTKPGAEKMTRLGELKGLFDRTDHLLHALARDEIGFETVRKRYRSSASAFTAVIAGERKASLHALQEEVLILQAELFDRLSKKLQMHLNQEVSRTESEHDIFLAIVLLTTLLGFYFLLSAYVSLSRCLRDFFETTVKISQGELHARVDINSADELGLLADEFNTMIESLDYHYALLNEYKRAVDSSAIVVKTDLNGVITYVNEAYEKISAYSKEELIGSTQKLVRSKNTSSEQVDELWEYIHRKQSYKTIFENVAKDGKTFFVESTVFPIMGRDNEVSEVISIMFDITPLYKQKEKLQSQLYKDELTSLPNRLKLVDDIKSMEDTKLVVINIDRFREINTIYGENIGDLVLQKMAKEIKNALNTRHLQLYKLSADEFAILAGKEISVEHFREDVTMLSHYLNHVKLECLEHVLSVRLTLGAAISALNHTQRPLISIADMALKEAKRRMRPYLFYDAISSVDEDLEKNYKMIQLIEKAIKEDSVSCCYQGIINAQTGEIEKYETLMRLEDEHGKQISAYNFVGIAKRSRFYPQLTQRVVQEAVYTFLKRKESVSINLSVDDVMDDETYFYILDILRNCDCADRVIFEFLETEEIEFNERIYDFITQVKKLGAKIAIDDFGSGYSNYAYLMKLGVDILKIDASLIKEVDKNEHSRLITKSIIDIAHALGMKTVAEHVHTKEIEKILKELGVDYMQGFYLHKPVCELQFTA